MGATVGDWPRALSSRLPGLQVLSLSYCNISVLLLSSLAKLQSLSVIRLDGNDFPTSFPDFFSEFANLTVLTASSCGFLGEFPRRIFQIPTLRIIDLSNNPELGGSLPEFFPENGSLESLDLSATIFSGNIPDTIGNLKMLSSLKLSACKFSGPIPGSISNLSQLVSVNLWLNNFTGSLPSFSLTRIFTDISLGGNKLNGKIRLEWEGLKNLSSLYLSNNLLDGDLPPFLFSLPSLESLILSNNNFSGQISELGSLSPSPLGKLDLSGNHLEGPIPHFVFKITSLQDLSLAFNKFTGNVELLEFVELKNLVSLNLSNSGLSVGTRGSDSAFSLLPQFNSLFLASCKLQKFPFLKNQSKLNMLDLSKNQITGDIPNWIWEAQDGYLRYVDLSFNHFTGLQEPYHFQRHDYLDLHSNMLAGGIPLLPQSAIYVDFSSNKFTSSLPADIGDHLSSAMFFNVANNGIVGDIPLSMCNATLLQVLYLSHNSLNGSVPPCMIEKSRSLKVLSLERNNLRGNIPNNFPGDCNLQLLDLSFNQLEEQIPKSLAHCRKLNALNLGHNRFSDTYPCGLDKLPDMRVLVLHFNRFSGQVSCPDTNHSWPKLQTIDLASNNFSGIMPPKFFSSLRALMVDGDKTESQPELLDYQRLRVLIVNSEYKLTINYKGRTTELKINVLTFVDISSNNFQGSIPETVGELRLLYFLNLSNNAFTGRIPPSFGNLKKLETLDLSSNKLAGKIPADLGSLTFLSFLNLSHNHLVGRIPKGTQIQTFPPSYFEGNVGLCGFPLNRTCNDIGAPVLPQPAVEEKHSYSNVEIYASVAVGFLVGLAGIFGPLWLSKRCRRCYNKRVDQFVLWIFHQKEKDWRRP